MGRRRGIALARLMATTSVVALSLAVAPVVLPPDFGGAGLSFADSGSSCFVAGTLVLMADGSKRPIEDLRRGDLVRGGQGGVNCVVGVETPRLAARRLYGFNGGRPFVTAEHPFLTLAGWKAIDPDATRRENATLTVAALTPGDVLTCLRTSAPQFGPGNLAQEAEVDYWLEPLKGLTWITADPETRVYNLLLDGDHSYVADGYVVHNKGGDDGGDDGGGDDGGGDDGGGESGSGGGSSGSGEGGGSSGSGEGGESSGSGEGGESSGPGEGGESSSENEEESSGKSGESGSGAFFRGDPGEAEGDLSPDEEADLIGRGWQ